MGTPYDPYFVQERMMPNKNTRMQQLDQRWRQSAKNVKSGIENGIGIHNQLTQENADLIRKITDNQNKLLENHRRIISQSNDQLTQQQKVIRDIRDEIFNNQRQMSGLATELMSALQQQNYAQVMKISQAIYQLGQDGKDEQRDIIFFK